MNNILPIITYEGAVAEKNKRAADKCKKSFSFFVKTFWHVIIAEDLVWEPHMDILCDEIQEVYESVARREKKQYDLIINIPPGTSKSTIVTIMAPAWGWIVDPSLRYITGSYSDSLATEHSQKCRDIVESDLYRLYFPEVRIKPDKGQKTNYETTKLGQRYSTSVGGAVTGVHAHIIIIDDAINPKQAVSKIFLVNANTWMDSTLSMRKVDKEITVTILIMQRLATNDPTGYLLAKGKSNVRHICLPGILSNDVTPKRYAAIYQENLLCPKRLSKASLVEAKKDLGSGGFAGQIQQRPVQEGGLIWRKWFIEVDDAIFPDLKTMTKVGTDWDLAYTQKDTNAGSAWITSGKINQKMFIDDIGAVYFEFPELIKFMKQVKAPHYIEAKACFVKGTLVRTNKGLVPIELINEGDSVMSFNIEKHVPEYKKVLKRFTHALPQHRMKIVTFKTKNFIIKCTSNHEFFINGSWIDAGSIAERIMGVCSKYKPEIFDFQHGKIDNYKLQRPVQKRANKIYEASPRSKWVFANSNSDKQQNRYRKDAQAGSSSIHSQSFEPASRSPQKLHSRRQPFGKFRVGNIGRKQQTHFQSRSSYRIYKGYETKKSAQRFPSSQCYIKRTDGKRNTTKIQATCLHKKNVGRRIRYKNSQRDRCHIWKGLEARELNTTQITCIEISYQSIHTYDLSIQDNHNYCITDKNIIVHNSGKSAKQTLVKNGIPAIEVEVSGGDKVARAQLASPYAEAGLCYIRKSLADFLYNDARQAILNFPRGSHADVADTLAQAIQRIFRGGVVVGKGGKSMLDDL